jgi:hypothetical protein
MTPAATGFRMHSGWGSLVAVSNDGIPRFGARQHIVVADANIPGSKQPYHYAEDLELNEAEKYLAACCGLRRGALPAFLPGISRSRDFGSGGQAYYCNRANRSLPVQSQSHLSGFHSLRARIVRLVEQCLASGNARSPCRCHRDGCDSTGRAFPRAQLSGRVCEL